MILGLTVTAGILFCSHIVLTAGGYLYTPAVIMAMVIAHLVLFILFQKADDWHLGVTLPIWCVFCEALPAAWVTGEFIHAPIGTCLFIFVIPALVRKRTH